MEDIEVKRFAVKYDPPTLVVEYKTATGALFLKKIRIKVKAEMDAERLCNKIIEKNSNLLGPDHVCRTQLMDLLNLLLQESAHIAPPEKTKDSLSRLNTDAEDKRRGEIKEEDKSEVKASMKEKEKDQSGQLANQIMSEKNSPMQDIEDLNEVDLNKFDDEALSKVKSKMDIKFDNNRITPDHPDFVWDKEVSFEGADEDCEWDEESD